MAYYFRNPDEGGARKVLSAKFAEGVTDAEYRSVEGFTGKDVRAAEVKNVPFPRLLDPVDDLPPATMVTSVQRVKGKVIVKGISQDNGDVGWVTVNGRSAKIISSHAGLVDWEVTLDLPQDRKLTAHASDKAGNTEKTGHERKL